jgi:hypothetical protein
MHNNKKLISGVTFFLFIMLFSCVNVKVNSTTRDANYGDKVWKIFIVAENDEQLNVYYTKLLHQLTIQFQNKGISTVTHLLPIGKKIENDELFSSLLDDFRPCHVLTIKELSVVNKVNEERHVEKDITLDLRLVLPSSPEKQIWRSSINVNTSGMFGFGTIAFGGGAKNTADKIIEVLHKDKVVNY